MVRYICLNNSLCDLFYFNLFLSLLQIKKIQLADCFLLYGGGGGGFTDPTCKILGILYLVLNPKTCIRNPV
jgi:hypothetical protein